MKNSMGRKYNPDVRENDPSYLLRQVQELLLIASSTKNTSALIYACLDARIALEILDLNIILHSVSAIDRDQIIKESKSKNGIDRMNKKHGALKEKYQLFFQAVCETLSVDAKFYDFKKSKDIQHKLSTYIHSYYMTNEDLKYDNYLMQNAINIIDEFERFLKTSFPIKDESLIMTGLNIAKIPDNDKPILEEWKNSCSMSYEELKLRLKKNHPS
jgi:hypothetical protein